MPFSPKIYTLYFKLLTSAKDHLEKGDWKKEKDLLELRYLTHKILGTASLFGDKKLSKFCEKIENDTQFSPLKNPKDASFLTQFNKELLGAISKSSLTHS